MRRRIGQGDPRGRAAVLAEKALQAAMRFQGATDAAPLADHLIHRPERAAGQDRRGDDHAARHLALNDQPGTQGQDGRLHQHAEGPGEGADHLARAAGALACGKRRVLQLPPTLTDLVLHAHGQNHLGIALAAFGKVAGQRLAGHAGRHRPLAQAVACPSQHRHHASARNGQPAEPGMHQKQHGQIQRHPRQVEQARHGRTRQKAAQQVQIAQGLGPGGAGQPVAEQLRPKPCVQLQRQPRQQAGAQKVVESQKAVQHHHHGKQPHQRRHRARGQHAVIDLQHVDRAGQHQERDHRTQARRRQHTRPQGAQGLAVGVGSGGRGGERCHASRFPSEDQCQSCLPKRRIGARAAAHL